MKVISNLSFGNLLITPPKSAITELLLEKNADAIRAATEAARAKALSAFKKI